MAKTKKMDAATKERIRAWLISSERLRLDRQHIYPLGMPSEQDIQDTLAILDWPEYRHWHTSPEMGASVVWAKLSMQRLAKNRCHTT